MTRNRTRRHSYPAKFDVGFVPYVADRIARFAKRRQHRGISPVPTANTFFAFLDEPVHIVFKPRVTGKDKGGDEVFRSDVVLFKDTDGRGEMAPCHQMMLCEGEIGYLVCLDRIMGTANTPLLYVARVFITRGDAYAQVVVEAHSPRLSVTPRFPDIWTGPIDHDRMPFRIRRLEQAATQVIRQRSAETSKDTASA